MQEIKISQAKIIKEDFKFPNYQLYWHPAQREGYSGTAFFVKDKINKQVNVEAGLGIKRFDEEGRVQVLEHLGFYLLNIYFPNANPELSRLKYKLDFNQAVLDFVNKLKKKKPVIVSGDFNVAHKEIDLARPKENTASPGFTPEERASMDKFIDSGMIDSFRFFHGDKIKYSWWSYRTAARTRNIGWRIDYFCVSDNFKSSLKKAEILDQELGSDHAPVVLDLKL